MNFIYISHHFTALEDMNLLPRCGFTAQLVEHRTGIAEVTGSKPVEALIFYRLLPSNCQKGLCRQLSMRILGAKFKFSVGHGKFNFPPLYAEIASSGRIPIVSFAIETIIAVDLKKYHAGLGLFFEEILYIFRPLRKKMASRKVEV